MTGMACRHFKSKFVYFTSRLTCYYQQVVIEKLVEQSKTTNMSSRHFKPKLFTQAQRPMEFILRYNPNHGIVSNARLKTFRNMAGRPPAGASLYRKEPRQRFRLLRRSLGFFLREPI